MKVLEECYWRRLRVKWSQNYENYKVQSKVSKMVTQWKQNLYRSCALQSCNKTDELRAAIWLRAAIYLVNYLVKKSDFGLIAAALKCVATVVTRIIK